MMEDVATTMAILVLGPTAIGLLAIGITLTVITAIKVVKGLKDGEDR